MTCFHYHDGGSFGEDLIATDKPCCTEVCIGSDLFLNRDLFDEIDRRLEGEIEFGLVEGRLTQAFEDGDEGIDMSLFDYKGSLEFGDFVYRQSGFDHLVDGEL